MEIAGVYKEIRLQPIRIPRMNVRMKKLDEGPFPSSELASAHAKSSEQDRRRRKGRGEGLVRGRGGARRSGCRRREEMASGEPISRLQLLERLRHEPKAISKTRRDEINSDWIFTGITSSWFNSDHTHI